MFPHPSPVKRFVISFGLTLLLQVAFLFASMILSGVFNSEIASLPVLYLYLPTILLVEEGGNFVGCSNFIWPLFLGVPLGIATYSFIASMVICQIRRRKTA